MAGVELAEAIVPGGGGKLDPKESNYTKHSSAELLSLYFSRLFPYEEMYRWLAYGNTLTDKNGPWLILLGTLTYFFHREISFTLEDDIYIRYLHFREADEASKRKS